MLQFDPYSFAERVQAILVMKFLACRKSLNDPDLILETKLDGALNLIRLVRPDLLKFTVLFSSIAGRFGNVGQSDYAAANEILNKLAHWLDRRWPVPCRFPRARGSHLKCSATVRRLARMSWFSGRTAMT